MELAGDSDVPLRAGAETVCIAFVCKEDLGGAVLMPEDRHGGIHGGDCSGKAFLGALERGLRTVLRRFIVVNGQDAEHASRGIKDGTALDAAVKMASVLADGLIGEILGNALLVLLPCKFAEFPGQPLVCIGWPELEGGAHSEKFACRISGHLGKGAVGKENAP